MTTTPANFDAVMRHFVESAEPSRTPAADMADLAGVIRTLLGLNARRGTRVRLGGSLFDVVITGSGLLAHTAVACLDERQYGCGPVIEDPGPGWLYWLVPPGSAERWEPHEHAVCLGGPHTITLPPLHRTVPPGPYWLRPLASDRLVPTTPLRQVLAQYRPRPARPAPHSALAGQLGTAP
ncbi:hypothetical protein OG923_33945 (plasmid) [Streptomyces halstedii]|uniref:hypothetical protein n=1 Tax=Streptomyces halstedii TaxID=1944 RepID=UPI003254EBB2